MKTHFFTIFLVFVCFQMVQAQTENYLLYKEYAPDYWVELTPEEHFDIDINDDGNADVLFTMKNRLKVARAEKDLTQEDLAKLIGVSRQSINAIESGRYVPSTVLALKMAQVFGKPVEEIFFLEEED